MRPVCSGEPLARKMPIRLDTTSSACTSERRLPSSAPACSSSVDGADDAVASLAGLHGAGVEHRVQRLGHSALGGHEAGIAVHPAAQGGLGRVPLQQLFGRRGHFGELGAVDRLDERLPVGEMAVQRADPDTGVARDRSSDTGSSLRGGERRGRHLEQPSRLRRASDRTRSAIAEAPPFLLRSTKRRVLRIIRV